MRSKFYNSGHVAFCLGISSHINVQKIAVNHHTHFFIKFALLYRRSRWPNYRNRNLLKYTFKLIKRTMYFQIRKRHPNYKIWVRNERYVWVYHSLKVSKYFTASLQPVYLYEVKHDLKNNTHLFCYYYLRQANYLNLLEMCTRFMYYFKDRC